jgi:TolB-like protein/Tfp pilus assembly protein PilF
MKYVFDNYSLDPEKFELRENGDLIHIEPQVFALLKLLIEHRDRLVSKDEIIAEVWNNRIVSDASIANRIKFVRSAIGDDGSRQIAIRTIHGKGFRFIAKANVVDERQNTSAGVSGNGKPCDADFPLEERRQSTKPSIAVLPFQFLGPADSDKILADAIPHDLIQALSRLRWLFVIARGSAFRFRSAIDDPEMVGKALGVRYLLAGSVEKHGNKLFITTELSDTHTGGVIWGDRFSAAPDDVHQIRQEIITKVLASLEVYIPLNEAQIARLSLSENLDSWSKYHLGLQHMYRFTRNDNERASEYFTQATELDPSFARAHAGLSFTSFQNAFLWYGGKQNSALQDAFRFAERSIELDPLDPFSNLNIGRALMLQGDLDGSVHWLDNAITLSPSYSQGYYSHAFSNLLAGKTVTSLSHFEIALALSPLDPLAYAMMSGRCLSFVNDGDFERAAEAGEKAARAPGAHFIVEMIALIAHSLNEDPAKAQIWADKIRRQRPDANQALFFSSFPFSDTKIERRISDALSCYGM